MILPFSINCPWVTPDGEKIPTDFKRKICQKIKIHTFREGHRWKAGAKVHFYMANPRNNGVRFQPPVDAVENWFSEVSSVTHSRGKFPQIEERVFQESFTPLLDGFENYKIRVDAIQGVSVQFMLWIDDFEAVKVSFNQVTHEIKHIRMGGFEESTQIKNMVSDVMLKTIAQNDGLSEIGFLRWFINSTKDRKDKESTGQILHWTPFRYVADIGAGITDSFVGETETIF